MMNTRKVVIIDDEWLIRAELRNLLSSFDQFQVVGEASNVSEATELLKKIHPDLIFLDINMPGYSGFDLLDQIEIEFDIIFISGYENKMRQAKQYNAVDYLLKPIKKERLAKALKSVIKKTMLT